MHPNIEDFDTSYTMSGRQLNNPTFRLVNPSSLRRPISPHSHDRAFEEADSPSSSPSPSSSSTSDPSSDDSQSTDFERPQRNPNIDEDATCRICQGGADEGVLISPCKCKGSMKYVHRTCLQKWREMSQNPRSAFQCDQCKFKYHFHRTQAAQWLASKITLRVLTIAVLLALVVINGYLGKILILLFASEEYLTPLSFDNYDMDEDGYYVYRRPSLLELLKVNWDHLAIGSIGTGLVSFFLSVGIPFISTGYSGPAILGNVRGRACNFILLTLVVIGLAKAASFIYNFVEAQSKKVLAKAEDIVENIAEDENGPTFAR